MKIPFMGKDIGDPASHMLFGWECKLFFFPGGQYSNVNEALKINTDFDSEIPSLGICAMEISRKMHRKYGVSV